MLEAPLPGLVFSAAIARNLSIYRGSAASVGHGLDICVANGICLHNCTFKYLQNLVSFTNVPAGIIVFYPLEYVQSIKHTMALSPSFKMPLSVFDSKFRHFVAPFQTDPTLCLFLFIPVKIKCWLNSILHLLYASSRACNLLEKCIRMPTILT